MAEQNPRAAELRRELQRLAEARSGVALAVVRTLSVLENNGKPLESFSQGSEDPVCFRRVTVRRVTVVGQSPAPSLLEAPEDQDEVAVEVVCPTAVAFQGKSTKCVGALDVG